MDLRHDRVGGKGGVLVVSYLLYAVMLGGTLPTPIYPLYAARLDLQPLVITVIFAAYAFGIITALLLFGGVSDRIGRRATLAPALLTAAASAVVFIAFPRVPGLLLGRFLCGVSVALTTGAATAYLAELHPNRERAANLAANTNMLGLGCGALLASVLVQYAPRPLITPYALLIVLLVPGCALAVLPETVARRGSSGRPRLLGVPAEVRSVFTALAVAVFAAFSVFGLLAALAGTFTTQGLRTTSHVMVGVVVFVVFAAAAIAQTVSKKLPPRRAAIGGMTAVPAGLALIVIAIPTTSLPLFLVGTVISGAGCGTAFRSGLALLTMAAPPHRTSEVVSSYFVAAYMGLTVPVIGVGLLLSVGTSLAASAGIFSGVIALLSIGSAIVTWRTRAVDRAVT